MSDMFNFSGVRSGWRITRNLKNSFIAAWEALPFHFGDELSQEEERIHLGSTTVVRMVLADEDGVLNVGKLNTFRRLLESECSSSEVERRIVELKKLTPLSPDEISAALAVMQPSDRERLLNFILTLAASNRTSPAVLDTLRNIFAVAGVDAGVFDTMYREVEKAEARRQRIIGSGAGILAALVVILVFIITATLLRSVIFGLILAYILLPLEKFFERGQREGHGIAGIACWFFKVLSLPFLPLRWLSARITRRASSENTRDDEAQKNLEERRIITSAVAQTVLIVLVVVGTIGFFLSRMTVNYVSHWRSKNAAVQTVGRQNGGALPEVSPSAGGSETDNGKSGSQLSQLLSKIDNRLDLFLVKFQKLPVIKSALDQAVSVLRDEKYRKELIGSLLKSSGGIFSFTAGVLGAVAAVIGDLLLTVFFALLFLIKLAEFCGDDASNGRKGEYLVRAVFNGNWLPDANDATVGEAKRIVGGILERLRNWARGYVFLIMVDTAFYTTVFGFLRVPYFPVLGLLAGFGLLLPYIGPVISASVTVLVTLAFGDVSGARLAGIIGAYLLWNGIVEQFVLYPAVIGESLGLTTLETIVVVLLGAVFAGIPGMFLALPAASVLKYIIPQIHHYLKLRRGADVS